MRERLAIGIAVGGVLALAGCGEAADHASGHTSLGCYTCHGDRYLATRDPDHVVARYPTSCEGCHTTTAWRPATFGDHAGWPLTGAHLGAACASCHLGGVYSGTPRECVGCHLPEYDATRDPPHAASGFPTRCETCHATQAWVPASFSHDDVWPLVGKHLETACELCHVDGVYTGTPRACVGCHEPDYAATSNPSHPALGLPTTCESCHQPTGWDTRTFPGHDALFPNSSGHHAYACESCHLTATWASFTCTGCHEGVHALARMNDKHADEADYQATLDRYGVDAGCLHCHRDDVE